MGITATNTSGGEMSKGSEQLPFNDNLHNIVDVYSLTSLLLKILADVVAIYTRAALSEHLMH